VRLALAAAFADWAAGVGYEFGAKPSLTAPPSAGMRADCSGAITRWVARAGVTELRRGERQLQMRDWHGSVRQREWCSRIRSRDSVAYALGSLGIGCLLFMYPRGGRPGHVALSLGNGYTVECRSRRGVDLVPPQANRRRRWDEARKLPELFDEIE
jgi:cell wall-associated NlpC family hydrolase